jgi:hypothetical protein
LMCLILLMILLITIFDFLAFLARTNFFLMTLKWILILIKCLMTIFFPW